MTEHDNLTTRDLADPRPAPGEAAEDMPLTREHGEAREHADPTAHDREAGAERVTPPAGDRTDADGDATAPLLPEGRSDRFEQRWHDIQAGFVDEPRQAVEQADTLVAELMRELAAGFSETRSKLEAQWDNEGDDVSTEDLRVALTRYRSFFNRLLSA